MPTDFGVWFWFLFSVFTMLIAVLFVMCGTLVVLKVAEVLNEYDSAYIKIESVEDE